MPKLANSKLIFISAVGICASGTGAATRPRAGGSSLKSNGASIWMCSTSTKKHDEEIPDFRTVKAESDEEDELQRAFEVMRGGGRDRDLLRGSIAFTWESYMKEKYPKDAEEPKQIGADSNAEWPGARLRKPEISTDEINKLINGLDELKLFVVCAENLRHAIDGDGAYGRLFEWPSLHKNPERGPAMWASEELWPFLMTVQQRLPDLHKRLADALVECWEQFNSIERLSEKAEQAGAKASGQ